MQLAYVTVATVSGPMAMAAGIRIGGVGTGRFMYCANVYMLLLGSGSAPQQPSHPCEAYGEQAQRELPLHIQVTVMVSAALAACWQHPLTVRVQISLKLARTGLAAGQSCQRQGQGCGSALSLHNLTCRDARRREQASTPLVKGADSMTGQGRMPSAVPSGPWSERCEVGGVSRGAPPAIGGTAPNLQKASTVAVWVVGQR